MTLNTANRILAAFCGFIFLIFLPLTSDAVILIGGEKSVEETITMPTDITPGQVGDFVAPLSEQQVRELLISNLEIQAQTNAHAQAGQSTSVIELLKGAGDRNTPLGNGIHATIEATDSFWLEAGKVFEQLSPGQGFTGFLILLVLLFIVVAIAGAVEWVCLYQWRRSVKCGNVVSEKACTKIKSGSAFTEFLINLAGLFLFVIAGYITADFLTTDDSV
jgi:hypothetical protein